MSNFKSSLINDLAVAKLGQPGGFAKLDENGLVTSDQLPAGDAAGSLSWVPKSFAPNPMNPFSSGLPQKLDDNGNPNVYHFNSSGPVSTDGTTVFAVQQDERLWYRTDTDSWYHEKNTPQYLGASDFNAGTAGIVPLAQQGQQNFVFKGDGNWGGAWGNLNDSGGPIPDGKYLIDAATAITITLDEAIGEVRLFDYKGLAATNNITVGTNVQTFTDVSGTAVAGPYVINTNNEDIIFVNNTGTNAFTVIKKVGVVNTVAEYGEQVLGSSITVPTTSTSPTVATNIMSFTLPSAGTWDVDFIVRGSTFAVTTSGANGMVVVVTDNLNNVIANTELKVGRESFASVDALNLDLQFSATGKVQIVTTGATTYKVRGYHDGSGGSTGSWTAQSDNNGRTKVSWNKIAGQLPAIMPTTINGGIAFGNGTQLIQDAPNLFYNNVSKRLGIGTSLPSSNLTIQDSNASLRLSEIANNQNLWFNRFTNRTVMASSDQIEIRTGSADGVNGASTTIDNSGNITQFGATKITTGTNGLRLPITSASANVAGGAIGVDANGDIVKIASSIGGGAVKSYTATEALAKGDILEVWNDAGTAKVRKAAQVTNTVGAVYNGQVFTNQQGVYNYQINASTYGTLYTDGVNYTTRTTTYNSGAGTFATGSIQQNNVSLPNNAALNANKVWQGVLSDGGGTFALLTLPTNNGATFWALNKSTGVLSAGTNPSPAVGDAWAVVAFKTSNVNRFSCRIYHNNGGAAYSDLVVDVSGGTATNVISSSNNIIGLSNLNYYVAHDTRTVTCPAGGSSRFGFGLRTNTSLTNIMEVFQCSDTANPVSVSNQSFSGSGGFFYSGVQIIGQNGNDVFILINNSTGTGSIYKWTCTGASSGAWSALLSSVAYSGAYSRVGVQITGNKFIAFSAPISSAQTQIFADTYNLNTTTGAIITANNQTYNLTGTNGEKELVNAGNVFQDVNGTGILAIASYGDPGYIVGFTNAFIGTVNTSPVGLAKNAITSLSTGDVSLNGDIITGLTGLTIGAKYYMNTTTGVLTTTTTTVPVGFALSATELQVRINA